MTESSTERNVLKALLFFIVFWGAWLLFQIEPLAGKIITPRFGGTSNVWIICLLFFQIVVLAGYLLTFALSRLPKKVQIIVYVLLLAASLFWTSVPGVEGWSFRDDADPTSILLSELTTRLAIPCIVLSSISGTMQVWSAIAGFANPYRLYSLSNLGSFGALITYPVFVEPALQVSTTLKAWQIVYYCLFAAAAIAGVLLLRNIGRTQSDSPVSEAKEESNGSAITGKSFVRWLFLSTLGSAGLLAFSSHITTDIAPVPLLWILPLAIYLLTFVIAFGKSNINKKLLVMTWVPFVVAEPICMFISPVTASIINLILLFEMCLLLNCELAETKPPAGQLPIFYLAIAAGGAVGGILVGLVAPVVFTFSGERLVCVLVFTVYQFFADTTGLSRKRLIFRGVVAAMMMGILIAWLIVPLPDVLHRERNFFGSVSVKREGEFRAMYHGRINHGQQYEDPAKADINASLYGQPVALTIAFLRHYRNHQPLKVGVIGLGAGAVAVEGHTGDHMTFYELDPKIVRIANTWFSYLPRSKATTAMNVGDGRLLLEKSPEQYDLISVDAFNGDAIPVHLLTVEAMKIYISHLRKDGLVIFNVTNLFLDVGPVVTSVAKVLQLHGCQLTYEKAVKYVVISADESTIKELVAFAETQGRTFANTSVSPLPVRQNLRAWTDDYSNLFSILKLRNF